MKEKALKRAKESAAAARMRKVREALVCQKNYPSSISDFSFPLFLFLKAKEAEEDEAAAAAAEEEEDDEEMEVKEKKKPKKKLASKAVVVNSTKMKHFVFTP